MTGAHSFIVDLEDADYYPPESGIDYPRGFRPRSDLGLWDLNARFSHSTDDDPMIPDRNDHSLCNDEEALQALAIRAKERAKEREQRREHEEGPLPAPIPAPLDPPKEE